MNEDLIFIDPEPKIVIVSKKYHIDICRTENLTVADTKQIETTDSTERMLAEASKLGEENIPKKIAKISMLSLTESTEFFTPPFGGNAQKQRDKFYDVVSLLY